MESQNEGQSQNRWSREVTGEKNMAIEIVVERSNQARFFFVFMRDHWDTLWPIKWYRLITIIKWRPTRKKLFFSFLARLMVYLEFGFVNSHIKGALPGYILLIRSVIIAWNLRSGFFFRFSQSSFLSFLISFFPECETQSERDYYCFNGGTCFRIPHRNSGPLCKCKPHFVGPYCDYYVPDLS